MGGGRALPSSLLLLSRAFTVTAEAPEAPLEGLKETLGVLPNKVIQEISLETPAGCAPQPWPARLEPSWHLLSTALLPSGFCHFCRDCKIPSMKECFIGIVL